MDLSVSPDCAYPSGSPTGDLASSCAHSPKIDAEDTSTPIGRICIAMLRDAHRLLHSQDVREVVDAISWIWGTERGFSFKTCCDVLGLEPDKVRSRYWIEVSNSLPELMPLTRPLEADEPERVINAAVMQRNEQFGQPDLFDFYVPQSTSLAAIGRLH